jgi:hypothetical protein
MNTQSFHVLPTGTLSFVVLLVLNDSSTQALNTDPPAKTIKTTKLNTQPCDEFCPHSSPYRGKPSCRHIPRWLALLAKTCHDAFLKGVGDFVNKPQRPGATTMGIKAASSQSWRATTVVQINTINLAWKGEACWLEEENSPREG